MTKHTMFEQTNQAMAPMKAVNQVAMEKTEQLVELQVASLQNYARMAMAHWREALAVNDVEAAKAFVGKHGEYLKSVGENAARDASAVMELGADYVSEVQDVLKDSATKAARTAA